MDRQRKLTRKHLYYYPKVIDRDSGQMLGHIADITTEGIRLVSKNDVEPDSILNLEIILAENTEDETRITAKAKSLWSDKDINPELYAVGFRFLDISSEERTKIDELISLYSFQR